MTPTLSAPTQCASHEPKTNRYRYSTGKVVEFTTCKWCSMIMAMRTVTR